MIGAGGVATVAAFKIAQNADVFTEFMIASRRKAKCDRCGAVEGTVQRLQARVGYQPGPALSGPDHYGCLLGLRMQLLGYCQLRT